LEADRALNRAPARDAEESIPLVPAAGAGSGPRPVRRVRTRLQNWAIGRRDDPIPTALTSAGCAMSAAALAGGLIADWQGFAVNVSASLFLAGPALLISNVVVKRTHAARARRRIEPLLQAVLGLLHSAVQTTQRAVDLLGVEAALEARWHPREVLSGGLLTVPRVRSALEDARTAIPSVEQRPSFPSSLVIRNPLEFPLFGVLLRLIRQIDELHPIPDTVTSANIADDWSQRWGVDLVYSPHLSGGIRDRKIGLSQVHQFSIGESGRTHVGTESYMVVVEWCLIQAQAIIQRLGEELPAGLHAMADINAPQR
jgi:hypothetical protein